MIVWAIMKQNKCNDIDIQDTIYVITLMLFIIDNIIDVVPARFLQTGWEISLIWSGLHVPVHGSDGRRLLKGFVRWL